MTTSDSGTRRLLGVVVATLLALPLGLAIIAGPSVAAPAAKVELCHYDQTLGTYSLVSVREGKAVDAHEAHGDGHPGQPVPGMEGYAFDDSCVPVRLPTEAEYLIVHYHRADGDYGDPTTTDFTDFWGLHAWGDIDEAVEWTDPVPFHGEDEFGRFAWVELRPGATEVGIIVHRGDAKDGTQLDRFVDPRLTPEVWLNSGDAAIYASPAEARGYARIHYHRDDGDYGTWPSSDFNSYWGLHLWGDAIDPGEGTEWTTPKPPTGIDDFGIYWDVLLHDPAAPLDFIIHRGDAKDVSPDQSFIPTEVGEIWRNQGVDTMHPTEGAARNTAVIHYRRTGGDYGHYASSDFNDYWGMHVWTGAASPPSWHEPLKPSGFDAFGPSFEVPLIEDATLLDFILHRGDEKDPGPDQSLDLRTYGHEAWYVSGHVTDGQIAWLLPMAGPETAADTT